MQEDRRKRSPDSFTQRCAGETDSGKAGDRQAGCGEGGAQPAMRGAKALRGFGRGNGALGGAAKPAGRHRGPPQPGTSMGWNACMQDAGVAMFLCVELLRASMAQAQEDLGKGGGMGALGRHGAACIGRKEDAGLGLLGQGGCMVCVAKIVGGAGLQTALPASRTSPAVGLDRGLGSLAREHRHPGGRFTPGRPAQRWRPRGGSRRSCSVCR